MFVQYYLSYRQAVSSYYPHKSNCEAISTYYPSNSKAGPNYYLSNMSAISSDYPNNRYFDK